MPWMGAGCCGGECWYFADDFDRANNDDLGANWLEDTEGDANWDIYSNTLRCTPDEEGNGGTAILLPTSKVAPTHVYVEAVDCQDGNKYDVLFEMTKLGDETECYIVRLTTNVAPTPSTLEIWKREDGAETLLWSHDDLAADECNDEYSPLDSITAGDTVGIWVCYDGWVIFASAFSNAAEPGAWIGVDGIDAEEGEDEDYNVPRIGLRHPGGFGNAIRFDNFSAEETWTTDRTCPPCACHAMVKWANEIDVTVFWPDEIPGWCEQRIADGSYMTLRRNQNMYKWYPTSAGIEFYTCPHAGGPPDGPYYLCFYLECIRFPEGGSSSEIILDAFVWTAADYAAWVADGGCSDPDAIGEAVNHVTMSITSRNPMGLVGYDDDIGGIQGYICDYLSGPCAHYDEDLPTMRYELTEHA